MARGFRVSQFLILVIFSLFIFNVSLTYAAQEGYGQWGTSNSLSAGNIQKVPEGYALTAIGYGSDDHKCIIRIKTAPVNADGSVNFNNIDSTWQNSTCPEGNPGSNSKIVQAEKYFNPTSGHVATGWSWGANTDGGNGSNDGYPYDECFYQEYMDLSTTQTFGWGSQYDGTCNDRGYPTESWLKNVIRAPAGRVIVGIGFNTDLDAELTFLAMTTREVIPPKTATMSVSPTQVNLSQNTPSATITVSNSAANDGSFTVSCGKQSGTLNNTYISVSDCSGSVGPNANKTFSVSADSSAPSGSMTIQVHASGNEETNVSNADQIVNVSYTATTQTTVNGKCGTANDGTFSSKPSSNLCEIGTASEVAGSGPWSWTCAGSTGTTPASCSAQATPVACTLGASATTINKGGSVTWSATTVSSGVSVPYPYFWYVKTNGTLTQTHNPGEGGQTPWTGTYTYNTPANYEAWFTAEKNGVVACESNHVNLTVKEVATTPVPVSCPVDPNYGLNYYYNGTWCNPNSGPPAPPPGGMRVEVAKGETRNVNVDECDDDRCYNRVVRQWVRLENWATSILWPRPLKEVGIKAIMPFSSVFSGANTLQFDCEKDGTYDHTIYPIDSYSGTFETAGICNYSNLGTYTAYARAVYMWNGQIRARQGTTGSGIGMCNGAPCEGSAIINVTSTPVPPTVELTATRQYYGSGSYGNTGADTLQWTVTKADSCTASSVPNTPSSYAYSMWQGSKSVLGGSQYIGSTLPASTEFKLTCTGQGGTAFDTVMVRIDGDVFEGPPQATSSCSSNGPVANVTWSYYRPYPSFNYGQTAYRVQIDDSSSFSSPEVDTGRVSSGSASYSGGGGVLVSGGTYYVRVKAWNAYSESNWSQSTSFTAASGCAFDYSLSNSGTSNVTKTSGNAFTQNVIGKNLITGGAQNVTLTLSGVPTGTTYSISNGTCSPTCTSVITFTVAPNTPTGTHRITVTGSPLNKQTSFNLVVSGSPLSTTCSASPTIAVVGQTVTWSAAVSGGTPPFTYAWSGTNIPTNPAPATNPYQTSYSTVGQKNGSVRVTDADGLVATCATSTVQINFDPQFQEF